MRSPVPMQETMYNPPQSGTAGLQGVPSGLRYSLKPSLEGGQVDHEPVAQIGVEYDAVIIGTFFSYFALPFTSFLSYN